MTFTALQTFFVAMTALAIGALIAVSLRGDYWRRQSASLERDYTMLRGRLRESMEEELQQAKVAAESWRLRNDELRKQNNALEISLDAASQQLDKTRDTLKKTDSMRLSASSAAKAMHERLDLLYILIPAVLRMPRNDADALLTELPADIGAMQNTELFEVCDKYINGGG
nr:MAG TPA: hypothetical protein [Caudoviricetes sp.]